MSVICESDYNETTDRPCESFECKHNNEYKICCNGFLIIENLTHCKLI